MTLLTFDKLPLGSYRSGSSPYERKAVIRVIKGLCPMYSSSSESISLFILLLFSASLSTPYEASFPLNLLANVVAFLSSDLALRDSTVSLPLSIKVGSTIIVCDGSDSIV